ncbi:MAG: hypothetical protein RLZZ592_1453 [Pseudomonadota bacterium]|jgi:hypothetical protein
MGTTQAASRTIRISAPPAPAGEVAWSLPADYFGSAMRAPQAVTLGLADGLLLVRGLDFVDRLRHDQIRLCRRSSSGRLLLRLHDGAMLDGPTDPLLEGWIARPRPAGPAGRPLRRITALLAAAALAWMALPATAERLVDRIPAQIDRHIGREMLVQLDQRWLQPSQLPATTQRDLRQRLGQQASSRCPNVAAAPWEAQFRARGRLHEPSAFALPGGMIVITDDRLDPAAESAPALVDTLCQELRQVQRRQGLRTLARHDPASLLLGLLFEDFSATVALAWPVLSHWLPLQPTR